MDITQQDQLRSGSRINPRIPLPQRPIAVNISSPGAYAPVKWLHPILEDLPAGVVSVPFQGISLLQGSNRKAFTLPIPLDAGILWTQATVYLPIFTDQAITVVSTYEVGVSHGGVLPTFSSGTQTLTFPGGWRGQWSQKGINLNGVDPTEVNYVIFRWRMNSTSALSGLPVVRISGTWA